MYNRFLFWLKKEMKKLPGIRSVCRKFGEIDDQLQNLNADFSKQQHMMLEMQTFEQNMLLEWEDYKQNALLEWGDYKQKTLCELRAVTMEQSNTLQQLRQKQGENEVLIEKLKTELEEAKVRVSDIQNQNLKMRFVLKKINNNPIRVVFLIEDPSLLKNIRSVFEEMNRDRRFEVILVNLWYKSYANGNYTYKRPDIEKALDVSNYIIYEAYEPLTETWLDLNRLMPDYVFFSRPYDYYRNEAYHIGEVAKYARTCYVPYGIQIIGGEVEELVLAPECSDLYYFFSDSAGRESVISKKLEDAAFIKQDRLKYLGYPGIDWLRSHSEIKECRDDRFTILWLPRWNTAENNCHFFAYKDVLVEYAAEHSACRVILRPHPLCFENLINTGELKEQELAELRKKYSTPNEIDETSDYLQSFAQSSVLVADETSLIAEYFLTEKPIVFCKRETHFSGLMEKLILGCYVVECQEELLKVLEQLKNGDDPLRGVREKMMKETLLNYPVTAAANIKEELWRDFTREAEYSSGV